MNAKLIAFGCLNLLWLTFAACTGNSRSSRPPVALDPDSASVVESCNKLAVDLYSRLAVEEKGNLFFSPASIDTALAMTYAGAAGPTAEQMAKTLHFSLPGDKLHPAFAILRSGLNQPGNDRPGKSADQLGMANALWGQASYAFKPEFLLTLQKNYHSTLNPVDFKQPEAARKAINDWVSRETSGKIKALIPAGQLDADTRLVLTSAIYFKGEWTSKFKPENTRNGPFTLADGTVIQTPMMRQEQNFDYAVSDVAAILALPYQDTQLEMLVLLPNRSASLESVERALSEGKLETWLKPLMSGFVMVQLPKFEFSSEFSLAKRLQSLGMTDAFDRQKANFSRMTSSDGLFIRDVRHKAFVAVDENGTEAAAATHESSNVKSAIMSFSADRPFIFLIRDRASGAILFMGRVVNPQE